MEKSPGQNKFVTKFAKKILAEDQMEYGVGAWYFSYSPDQALIEVVPMLATRVTVLMILSNLMIWSLGAC